MELPSPESRGDISPLDTEPVTAGGVKTIAMDGSDDQALLSASAAEAALVNRIAQRIQRRVRNLRVAFDAVGTTVSAEAGSWHDRQLIEQAILKEVTGTVTIEVLVRP